MVEVSRGRIVRRRSVSHRCRGSAEPLSTQVPTWWLLLGGLLVGFGARMAGGCTSGHGICGLASLKRPSLLAVLTFMTTGFITAQGLAARGAR